MAHTHIALVLTMILLAVVTFLFRLAEISLHYAKSPVIFLDLSQSQIDKLGINLVAFIPVLLIGFVFRFLLLDTEPGVIAEWLAPAFIVVLITDRIPVAWRTAFVTGICVLALSLSVQGTLLRGDGYTASPEEAVDRYKAKRSLTMREARIMLGIAPLEKDVTPEVDAAIGTPTEIQVIEPVITRKWHTFFTNLYAVHKKLHRVWIEGENGARTLVIVKSTS